MSHLPPPAIMYRALRDRDATFEGVFYVGVRTTGIFCRPTCPARKPKEENVQFFAFPREALQAGYRPCARCAPLEVERPAPALVRALRNLVDESPGGKISGALLRARGIDPSTARRQFQRYYGMTFHAYQCARRLGLALHEIRRGESVIGAQIDHGYESASGFFEAFRNAFGAPPSRLETVACLFAQAIETPLGPMVAVADDSGLHLLDFVDRGGWQQTVGKLRERSATAVVPGPHPHLAAVAEQLKSYFEGRSLDFSVPLVPDGTPFELAVWSLLQTIPPGAAWSYAQMAARLGRPAAVRAVGRANSRNRLALVIPCHRVIRADGTLCGYGGGIWRKQWLLAHERRVLSRRETSPVTPGPTG